MTTETDGHENLPEISPDSIEQDFPEAMDNIVPTRGFHMTPMVGLGGSAGSIGGLQEFFQAMPPDCGMVFVVVLHLSPEHESMLAELLQRTTSMRVVQARDGEQVEPNHVYVIPPGKHLSSFDGQLRLTELTPWRGKRVAVDLFFRTLADTHGPHATAIVLSGADGDGSIGIKRIKERGGLTVAQDPGEAEHPGMPRTAIATGMVDWVLRVAQMPSRLMEFYQTERRIKLPPEETPAPAAVRPGEDEAALRDVLTFLKMRTGRDFTFYKRATILRRISRRMQVNYVENLPGYLDYLRLHAGEAGALLQDLLISVTNFFRDRESFEALEAQLPGIFAGKSARDVVRVWVPACATGEEAYSIAMMLLEQASRIDAPPTVQVFATDLDEEVIQVARRGEYTSTIAADVSDERLRRFFIKDQSGYRLRREVREAVLFATHDVLRDSPFSRLDLVSCRNLLIYLTRAAQARVLDTFHFALVPEGRLFLGSSESTEDANSLFTVLDKKHRIYKQIPVARSSLPVPIGGGAMSRVADSQLRLREGPAFAGPASRRSLAKGAATPSDEDRMTWAELHFMLLEQFAPPSVIVNRQYDIQHLSENAGRFLQFIGGEPTANLIRSAHPMLRIELRSALYRAAESGKPAEALRVPMEIDGVRHSVDIRVKPATELAPDYLLVVFDARPADGPAEAPRDAVDVDAEPAWRHLERELEDMRSQHREVVEQYEASTEELQASNEELQAMNEELRSATEELETGREELQSINEELTTVNSELKSNVDELAQSNSDLHNLMAATAIASVFVNRAMHITRFTPAAVPLFNLIGTDVGRPLNDLRHRLDYPEMMADVERVLERLVPVEREVRAQDARTYLARFHPYRTTDDRIAGVVLTFVDVTESNRVREELRQAEGRFRTLVEQVEDYAIFMLDPRGRATSWNEGVRGVLGFEEAEFLGLDVAPAIFTPDAVAAGVPAAELREAAESGTAENDRWMRRKDGSHFWASGTTTALRDDAGRLIGFTKVMRDQTEIKQAEEGLARLTAESERARRMYEAILSTIPDLVFVLDRDRRLTYANGALLEIVGLPLEDAVGRGLKTLGFAPLDAEDRDREIGRVIETGRPVRGEVAFEGRGGLRYYDYILAPILGADGEVEAVAGSSRDVTERKLTEVALLDADRKKDMFLATLAHELRNPLAAVRNSLNLLGRAGREGPASEQARAIMTRQVDHLVRLVDDLLEVSRITNGKIELRRRPVEIGEVVEAAVEASLPAIEAAGHELQVSVPRPSPVIDADPVRIAQVVSNLLNNSARHAERGGRVRLEVREEADVVVRVQDDGVGIPPDMLSRVFDMFTQVDRDRRSSPGGLGIGLALVKSLVEMHGGTIEAHSAGEGKGCEFVFRLPVAGGAPAGERATSEGPAPSGFDVLVVDDDSDSASSLGSLLTEMGNEVRVVNGGEAALAAFEAARPSVVLLDLGMAGMDGYEVARRIRLAPGGREVGLAAVTGWGRDSDRDRTKAAGFDAHFVKPVEVAELERFLRSVAADRSGRRRASAGPDPPPARGRRAAAGPIPLAASGPRLSAWRAGRNC